MWASVLMCGFASEWRGIILRWAGRIGQKNSFRPLRNIILFKMRCNQSSKLHYDTSPPHPQMAEHQRHSDPAREACPISRYICLSGHLLGVLYRRRKTDPRNTPWLCSRNFNTSLPAAVVENLKFRAVGSSPSRHLPRFSS